MIELPEMPTPGQYVMIGTIFIIASGVGYFVPYPELSYTEGVLASGLALIGSAGVRVVVAYITRETPPGPEEVGNGDC